MLRSVKALDHYTQAVYECMRADNGFICRCGKTYILALCLPRICGDCGAKFTYAFETEWLEMGMGCAAPGTVFFANAQDPAQRLDRPNTGTAISQEFRNRQAARLAELIHQLGMGAPKDIGPTTACFDCGKIIPIGDCFYSSTVDQRALCERCYGKVDTAGRAKCRS